MNTKTASGMEIIEKTVEYELVVRNFTETFKKCKNLEVMLFKFDVVINGELTKWQFQLYPKGITEASKEYVSLYLQCLSKSDTYVKVEASIIMNSKQFKIWFQLGVSFGFPRLIQHKRIIDNKEEFLPGDQFTICCKMFLDKTNSYCEKVRNGKVEDFDDYAMLWGNSKLSDITIIFEDGKKLPAHKYILAKKSSVFAAIMFEHEMLESKTKEIRITDISTEAIENMIRFIYTGVEFHYDDADLLDLLKAADKYAVDDLKKNCEKSISKKLSIENCFKIIEAADKFNADVLKVKAIQFIAKNAEVLIEKPEFNMLKKMNAEIACDILHEVTLGIKNQSQSAIPQSGKKATKRCRRN